jgi:hypothetical protein
MLWFPLWASGFPVSDPLTYDIQRERGRASGFLPPSSLSMNGNAITNGDFRSGLDAWTTTGEVSEDNEEAVLVDGPSGGAMLFQGVDLVADTYVLSFDVQSALSSAFTPGTFPDTFFASLYFIDDAGDLDIGGGVFDASLGLMDLDWQGVFNSVGTVGPSLKGPGWFHYSTVFVMNHAHVAVAFDLVNLNGQPGDSSVRLDNVMIAVIPEPSTWGLTLAGLAWLIWRRRWT